jgi:hypothetical protein
MHVMAMIAGIDAKNNRSGCPRNDFLEGVAPVVSPLSSTPILKSTFRAGHVTDNFRATEDDVDAATPMDAQNAPTGVWKSRSEREIPTAPTSIIFILKRRREEKKNEEQISSNQLSTKSDQIQQSYAFDNAVLW